MSRDHDGSEVEGAALAAAAIAAEAALSVARDELEARQARVDAVRRAMTKLIIPELFSLWSFHA